MKYRKSLLILGVLAMLISIPVHSHNEGEQLSIATYRTIYSNVLNEERIIAVSVPIGYETSGNRYPVFYVLDAEYASFAWSIGLVHFLSQYHIPEMIIVGVLNTNRNRDLWSHKIEGLPHTKDDGAQNFINFFASELIPFINQNYRTTQHRTIYGRSAAGHFVTYCLLANPDLFEAYLTSSPVIGFSDNQLLEQAENFFRTHTSLSKSFFVYYGDTDYISVTKRIPVLEAIIRENTPNGFNWGVKRVSGRHGPPESLYELLLMLHSDWTPVDRPVVTPFSGEMLEGDSIIVHISSEQDPVFYTLNGDEPTRSSPKYTGLIKINESTILKAKSIRGELQEGRTVSAKFTVVDKYRPAQNVTNLKNGLEYKYVEKQSFDTPDRIAEPPMKSGVVPSVDIRMRERDQFYLLQFEGFIKIPASGKYRFTIISNASKIFVDDELFSADHGLLPTEKVKEICLEKGYHSIRVLSCILTEQVHALELYWEGPGINKQKIPEAAYYHQ